MNSTAQFRLGCVAVLMAAVLSGCGGGAASALSETISDTVASAVDVASENLAGIAVVPMLSSQSGLLAANSNPAEPGTNTPQVATVTTMANAAQAVRIYTPAQIRAAYQLPALPLAWNSLSASQQASLGAGQTVYIVAAKHNPNVVNELQAFSRQFNLPSCTQVSIPTSQALPLAAPTSSNCQIAVVYASTTGMTSTAPAYDRDWAMEIALDVQWVHATAPLARLVLIEASDASTPSILAAINLANAMGPGVVSMSFGTPEGSWVTSMDSTFSSANMTYVAAAGDNGTGSGAQWPSVSSQVLAVGGTSLNSYTNATRSETVWSSTGGSRSQYIAVPSYQTSSVPGLGTQTYRSVADVAFNADPSTGQYVAVIPPGQTNVSWYSMGGTSLGTPQWAGIVAVANAQRILNTQGALGLVQKLIYPASSVGGFYGTPFADITTGNSGAFFATSGYDIPSGLGTPNVSGFLTLATNSTGGSGGSTSTPPTVSSLRISGVAGSPLSFSVAHTAPNTVTWSVSGAPTGLSVGASSGIISWASPVAGTYSFAVKATDTVTHLSGEATVSMTIAAATAPVVQSVTLQGSAGTPLSYRVPVANRNPVAFALGGAVPSGMGISSTGLLTWPQPVSGNYAVNVVVTDIKTGASTTAVVTLEIGAALVYKGPIITAAAINGSAGTPLTSIISITDSDPGVRAVSVSIKGAPAGMSFGGSGQGMLLRWLRPVTGSYDLVITATDNLSPGHSAQATVTVTIN